MSKPCTQNEAGKKKVPKHRAFPVSAAFVTANQAHTGHPTPTHLPVAPRHAPQCPHFLLPCTNGIAPAKVYIWDSHLGTVRLRGGLWSPHTNLFHNKTKSRAAETKTKGPRKYPHFPICSPAHICAQRKSGNGNNCHPIQIPGSRLSDESLLCETRKQAPGGQGMCLGRRPPSSQDRMGFDRSTEIDAMVSGVLNTLYFLQ